jgi:hypothetical protein
MERPRGHRQADLEFGPETDARFAALAMKVLSSPPQKAGENERGAFLQDAPKAAR